MRWLEAWFEGSGGSPRAVTAARKLLGAGEQPWEVVVASPDDTVRRLVADCLEPLAGMRTDAVGTPDTLALALPRQERDLVVLDLALAAEIEPVIERAIATHPRPGVILVHAGPLPAERHKALEKLPGVLAVVSLDESDRAAKLVQATARALAWVREQRQQAAVRLSAAEAALAAGRAAEGARALVAAYDTGHLAGSARAGLRDTLERVIQALPEDRELLVALRRVAIADRHDHLDEQGLIYQATSLRDIQPDLAPEAETWLVRADALAGRVYALIDQDLQAAGVQRRLGNHTRVLEISEAILARLSNVMPAQVLRADALRMLGRLDEAIEMYLTVAEGCLRDGEVERFYQILRQVGSLDLTGDFTERIANSRIRAQRLEEELSDPAARPRYPALLICTRALCREVAESSRGFFAVDPSITGGCDVCGVEPPRTSDRAALSGKTIAIIGGRLAAAYERALGDIGVREVLCHEDAEDATPVPTMIQAAGAVILVTGACSHAAILRAYRELERTPKPTARVHFYGARQVARAASRDLAPKLAALAAAHRRRAPNGEEQLK